MEREKLGYKQTCPYCRKNTMSIWRRQWMSKYNPLPCKECGKDIYPMEKMSYLMDVPILISLVTAMLVSYFTKNLFIFIPIYYIGIIISLFLQYVYVPLTYKQN